MSVTSSEIPQIAITHEEVAENDENEYLSINEALTDTEDIGEDDKINNAPNLRSSKLKIVFNTDTYTTDVEDIDLSDDNQEDEEGFSYQKPIDLEELDLEQGTVEESYKNNVKFSDGKKIRTIQKSGIVPTNYEVFYNYTDEELFDTDNEMQTNDTPNNSFNANSYETGVTNISDNHTLTAHPSSIGYLTAQSLSPNLSDLTDIEIIQSDSEEEINKKKSKSKRKKRNHSRAVTDTEDLEFSDTEATNKIQHKKPYPKHRTIPKSISLNFDSSKEDEEPLFPICKKIAEKKKYILNIPEFDTQTNTDTEDFASILDIGSPEDDIPDLEVENKVEEIADCYSQITESQNTRNTSTVEINNEMVTTSGIEIESDDSGRNKSCHSESESEPVENVNISTEEDYDENEIKIKQFPEIELPAVVRNITIFSEKNGVPTISVLPLEDSSFEEDDINDKATDEEMISDVEEMQSASIRNSPLVEMPDIDWGVISVKEDSQDQGYKNINETDICIVKRRRPPKFKYLYEKQNKLTVKQENKGNITDTEDIAIDDKKAKEYNYTVSGNASEDTIPKEQIVNGADNSDTDDAITSTDDDFGSHSRTDTPTLNLVQKEFEHASISEVNVINASKPLSEGVMYLKGGGYNLKVTDVEDLSEDDITTNDVTEFCGCNKSSQPFTLETSQAEWESQKDELRVNKQDGTADKKDVPETSMVSSEQPPTGSSIKAEGEEGSDKEDMDKKTNQHQ